MVKEKSTETLEETLKEYERFLGKAKFELLVVIPDSQSSSILYGENKIRQAFFAAQKRGVTIKILLNRERKDLPGFQYNASVVLLEHYAVSDRQSTFEEYFNTPGKGIFTYDIASDEFVKKFESTPILP